MLLSFAITWHFYPLISWNLIRLHLQNTYLYFSVEHLAAASKLHSWYLPSFLTLCLFWGILLPYTFSPLNPLEKNDASSFLQMWFNHINRVRASLCVSLLCACVCVILSWLCLGQSRAFTAYEIPPLRPEHESRWQFARIYTCLFLSCLCASTRTAGGWKGKQDFDQNTLLNEIFYLCIVSLGSRFIKENKMLLSFKLWQNGKATVKYLLPKGNGGQQCFCMCVFVFKSWLIIKMANEILEFYWN